MDELPTIKPEDFSHIDAPKRPSGHPAGESRQVKERKSHELRASVWQLYCGGKTSYRMIEAETGVPKTTIGRWIREEIDSLAKERGDLAEQFLEAELQRLDMLLEVCMKDVTTSIQLSYEYKGSRREQITELIDRVDTSVVNSILKIQERRAKYLALDKPTKHEVTHEFDLTELIEAAMELRKSDKGSFVEAEFEVKDDEEIETSKGDENVEELQVPQGPEQSESGED